MPNLNVVLVSPQIPQNTGNIARTCAATGAALHIVRPMGFEADDAKLKRAGLDYWHLLNISYYDSLKHFFAETSGEYYFLSTKAQNVYADARFPNGAFLVFGREDQGLPEELLLENPGHCLRLPMINGARSLNLSNAVAVCVYEALRQWGFPALEGQGNLTRYNWKG